MNASSGRAGRGKLGDRLLWVALAASTLFNHHGLLDTPDGPSRWATGFEEALYDPSASSPVLGLLVFAAILAARRRELRLALGQRAWLGLAGPCLAVGIALRLLGQAVGGVDLVLPALVLVLLGAAAWLGGRALVRVVAFPLLALVFVIPLPATLLHRLVFPLQLGTVAFTSLLLDLVGRAHLVAGDLILTDGASFQVIEGCSGLKTILSLGLAAVAYAELVARREREKLVLVALSPLIAFFVNGLRVLVLVFRKVPADTLEHDVYGVAAVVLGVVLLAAVELGLSRTLFRWWRGPAEVDARSDGTATAAPEPEAAADAPGTNASPTSDRLRARLAAITLASLVVSGILAGTPTPFWPRPELRNRNIEDLPTELAGREARGLRIDDDFLGTVRFGHRFYRAYEREGEQAIRVFVGSADLERPDWSALSPKTAIPHSGWLALERLGRDRARGLEREWIALRYDPRLTGDRSLDEGEAQGAAGASTHGRTAHGVLVEHIRMGFAPWEAELLRGWLGLDLVPWSSPKPRLVIRIEADFTDDRAEAELRLRQFAQEVVDWYRSAG